MTKAEHEKISEYNKIREFGTDLIQAWNQIHCIVHDKNMVMYRRTGSDGKKIRYLDFRK